MGRAPMHSGGRVRADAPDPREGMRARAAGLGVRAAGFVPQRHLEDWGISGVQSSEQGVGDEAETRSVTLSRTATVWRNPEDHDDPANLGTDDDDQGDGRGGRPGTGADDLPAWITWMRDRARFPSLWEGVRTHWTAPGPTDERPEHLAELLAGHVDHVLHNRFRAEHGLGDPTEEPWRPLVRPAAVQPADVVVDGAVVAGGRLDTDPFVLGVGAPLADGRVLTAVVPRSLLDLVTLEFVSDGPDGPGAD